MPAVTNIERHLDGVTPWGYGPVTIGLVGDGYDDAGGRDGGYAKNLTAADGTISFTLPASRTGEYYVWTSPDRTQTRFIVPASGGPYSLQALKLGGITLPGVPSATADALAALAASVAGLGGGSNVKLASAPSGGTDTTTMQAELTAAAAAGQIYQLRAGVYRAHGLVPPAGCVIDARGATIKVPNGVTAGNILAPTTAFTIIAGILDGNKGSATDPGSITSGNGIYLFNATGWTGVAQIIGTVIHDCWQNGVHAATDVTSLHLGANAPAAAIYLDRVETYSNGQIGQRFTGLRGVVNANPNSHGNGSHGIREFLCRDAVTANASACDNPSGHGMSSLYCYGSVVSGKFNRNGTDGLVFGGDSTSNVNMPGQYMTVPWVECNANSNLGLCFDASLAGTNTLFTPSLGTTDPVPVYGEVGVVRANGNTNEGVQVTSSQHVHFGQMFTDDNGGHGAQFSSRNVSFDYHHAWRNAQKPLALQGNVSSPNWGVHVIGQRDYSGNSPDDTNTIGTVVANSTWLLTASSQDTPPSPAPVYSARKTAGTSRISSVTLTADPDLTIASLPVGEYQIDGFLAYDASTTADLAIAWNMPAGSISWGCGGLAGTATSNNPATINETLFTAATGPVLGGVGVGTGTFARITGWLKVTTAGAMTLKWAQNSTDATNTTLQAGSWIRFTKIA